LTTTQSLQKCLDYIDANLQAELNMQELADLVGFSPYYFCRLFSSIVGMPVSAYITKRRLKFAIYAIQNGTKITNAALAYGFDTHAGFYKAFCREFGCSPSKYLKINTATRPVAVELHEEGKFMLTQTQIRQLLTNWDIDPKQEIGEVTINGGARIADDSWAIGTDHILQTGKNIAGLRTHITISKTLAKNGMDTAYPIPTKTGADFITADDRYFVLNHRVKGNFLTPLERYTGDRINTGYKYGQAIGQLHQVLAKQDHNLEVNDTGLTPQFWRISA